MKNSCKIDQCYRLDENSSRLDLILHTDNSSTLDQMKSLDLIRPVFSKTGRTDRFIKELYKKTLQIEEFRLEQIKIQQFLTNQLKI